MRPKTVKWRISEDIRNPFQYLNNVVNVSGIGKYISLVLIGLASDVSAVECKDALCQILKQRKQNIKLQDVSYSRVTLCVLMFFYLTHGLSFASPLIRVLIAENNASVSIKCSQSVKFSLDNGTSVNVDANKPLVIKAGNRTLLLPFKSKSAIIKSVELSSSNDIIGVNNLLYRGRIRIYVDEPNNLNVLNVLPIDDYLKGVIPNEIYTSWPAEMIAVQSIVARTYAIIAKNKNSKNKYDLRLDTLSQVYKGFLSEDSKVNYIVDKTADKVLFYDKTPVEVFFHSHCGGWTEKKGDVWLGKGTMPYEDNIRDTYCMIYHPFTWTAHIKESDFRNALVKITGRKISHINDVLPQSISPTGRVKTLLFVFSNESLEVKTNDIRLYLKTQKINSALFTIKKDNNEWILKGSGFGHGVGLCQWGARILAQEGKPAIEIIQFYYPGVYIRDYTEQ